MNAIFWTALGLLLAVVGVEAWLVRKERRQRASAPAEPQVPPAKLGPTVQLVREPAPLEQPEVLGRIGRPH